jgi:cytochrome c oxidase assembly protein subunit 15
MAFREWLTPDGYFMPLYPWLSAARDQFIEHGHRLLAMSVGMLTIVLAVVVHRCDGRRWVQVFSLALLGGVLFQGLLGGLRVVLDERLLALVHGCVGPLFFAATAAMLAVTSPKWNAAAADVSAGSAASHRALARLAVATAALVYLQLVLGAIVRHSPYLLGDRAEAIFRTAVYAHVMVALLVVFQVLRLAAELALVGVDRPVALGMGALVVIQLLLGGVTWILKYGVPQWAAPILGGWQYVNTEADLGRAAVITAHGAVGALLAALSVVAAVHAGRRSGVRWGGAPAPVSKGAVA